MNYVVATSRGAGLEEYLPSEITVDVHSGMKIKALASEAKKLVPPPYGLSRRPHIYFLCGVPDHSELFKSPYGHHYKYRECVYVEEPSVTANRYYEDLRVCQRTIMQHGALPVFTTIPKFNLSIYNNKLLSKNETSCLNHLESYDLMQKNLEAAIDLSNKYIYELNLSISVSTPFLHDTVMERRGRKNGRYYALKWNRYYDGLHAGDALLSRWADVLQRAMKLNNQLEDSTDEEKSPKRSWKYEKRPRVE